MSETELQSVKNRIDDGFGGINIKSDLAGVWAVVKTREQSVGILKSLVDGKINSKEADEAAEHLGRVGSEFLIKLETTRKS